MQGTLKGSLHLFIHIRLNMCRGIAGLWPVRTVGRFLVKA